jgi:hypothetical protein
MRLEVEAALALWVLLALLEKVVMAELAFNHLFLELQLIMAAAAAAEF